jgi:hypothetical protein
MIDWWSLMASALWILGLSWGLAAAGFAYWTTSSQQDTGSRTRTSRHVRMALDRAGVLFGIGWAASSSEIWERLVWCLVTALLAIDIWRDWRGAKA